MLVKQQIARLQDPSLECAHLIYEELRKVLFQINIPEISRYENFHSKINEVMEKVLKDRLVPTNMMIKNLIDIELDFINTNHPDFIDASYQLFGGGNPQKSNSHRDSKDEASDTEKKNKIKE